MKSWYVYWIIFFIAFSQAPENSSFLVNIHEPIIWRLHDMIQHVNIGRLSKSQTAAVSVDPMIKIGYVSIHLVY